MPQPFHLAIPVTDLERARQFYTDVMQCEEGRSSSEWVDLNFFGHQLVIHVSDTHVASAANAVDGKHVPIPHFGVVLEWDIWHQLRDRLIDRQIAFAIEPYIRFEGLPGEQATMFFYDTEGNALEFKSFKDIGQLFAS
jgi:extradiol dioxygenase family protein